MANTVIKHQPSTAGSNRYKYTISGWFKRSKLTDREMFLRFSASSGGYFFFEFKSDDTIGFNDYDGGASGRCEYQVTTRKFRDTNAYYHLVLTVDSTETSSSDRVKIWVNGELQTIQSNGSEVCPSNYQTFATSGALQYVGGDGTYTTRYYNGVISHLHFCEGYAYDASDFGSTDATTGEWKINTSPSVTYGTNGFFLFKDDNSLTDRSGQGNNFSTHSGTLTKTEDNPSNVFAVLNSLPKSGVSFSYGNLQADNQSSDWTSALATFGSSTGKWYAEFKVTDDASGTTRNMFGVCDARDVQTMSEDELGQNTSGRVGDTVGYSGNGSGNCLKNGSDQGSGFNTTYTIGDIISVALDCDNGAVYIAKNGTYLNSGSPTSGASKTGAVTITTGETYLIGGTVYNSTYQANFGNGYFGTTAVSSAGTNASGIGIFEHDVPTGFTSLSTKGLNL